MKLASLLLLVMATTCAQALELSGDLRYRLGAHYHDNFRGNDQQLNEILLQVDWERTLGERQWMQVETLYRSDYAKLMNDKDAPRPSIGDQQRYLFEQEGTQLELRRFTWSYYGDNRQLVIGKQQIVWGNADGIRVLNVVNPYNYREFILGEDIDARIPEWSAKMDYQWRDINWQWIAIFEPQFNVFAQADTPFHIPVLPTAQLSAAPWSRDNNMPDETIKDGDMGMRISGFHFGWDWAISYLYHYRDTPVFIIETELNPESTMVQPGVTERYFREALWGLELAQSFGTLTVRNELAFAPNRAHSLVGFEAGRPTSLQSRRYRTWENVLGVDWNPGDDMLFGLQWHRTTIGTDRMLLQQESEADLITLLWQRHAWNRKLKVRLQGYRHLDDEDHLIRASARYEVNNTLALTLAADLFDGNPQGTFGYFDHQDRVLLTSRFYF